MVPSQLARGHCNAVYLKKKGGKWSVFLLMLLGNQVSFIEAGFHFRTNQPLHSLTFLHALSEVE